MSRVSPWWGSNVGQGYAINALDEELANERAARRREARSFAAEQSKVQQDLEQVDSRLNSVTDQIGTVLEWTELRFQLLEFDEYQARKEIRKTFRAVAGRHPADLPEVDDVPGYWMPPAAMAVLPLVLRGHAATGIPAQRTGSNLFADLKAGLETARERDAIRAELFNLAIGLCFDQPAFIDAAVLRLLTEPVDLGQAEPGQVAAGWRTLWEQAARGAFGPGAAAQLTDRLRGLFDPDAIDADELKRWDREIERFGREDGFVPSRSAAFDALRAHLTAAETEPEALAVQDDPRWRVHLQELIEEPSPAELPLVRAMEELHLSDDEPSRSRPSWSEAAGTVAELVRRDLFDPECPIALRRLALELSAPLLCSRIEHVSGSLDTPEPVVKSVRRQGKTVEVRRDGHDLEQLAAIEARIDRDLDTKGPSLALHCSIAVSFGLLVVVMLAATQWVAAVLFAIGVVVPLGMHRKDRAERDADARLREEQLADLRADLVRARKAVQQEEAQSAERLASAREAQTRLLDILPPVTNAA